MRRAAAALWGGRGAPQRRELTGGRGQVAERALADLRRVAGQRERYGHRSEASDLSERSGDDGGGADGADGTDGTDGKGVIGAPPARALMGELRARAADVSARPRDFCVVERRARPSEAGPSNRFVRTALCVWSRVRR